MKKSKKNYFETTVLFDQEINPSGPRHRFGANNSVFPIRIVDLNLQRFRHYKTASPLDCLTLVVLVKCNDEAS